MSDENLIKYLRKQIPNFKCDIRCHDCCGPIVFSEWEWDQVKNKKTFTSINCPYICEEGCEIYEDRPIICRLYGTVKRLQCPHGYGPNKMLSKRKEREIWKKYWGLPQLREFYEECRNILEPKHQKAQPVRASK